MTIVNNFYIIGILKEGNTVVTIMRLIKFVIPRLPLFEQVEVY